MVSACILDANFSSLGNCIVHGMFFGDFVIAGIFAVIIFGILMAKLRIPAPFVLMIGLGLFFFLMASVSEQVFAIIFLIGVIITAVITILGVLAFAKR